MRSHMMVHVRFPLCMVEQNCYTCLCTPQQTTNMFFEVPQYSRLLIQGETIPLAAKMETINSKPEKGEGAGEEPEEMEHVENMNESVQHPHDSDDVEAMQETDMKTTSAATEIEGSNFSETTHFSVFQQAVIYTFVLSTCVVVKNGEFSFSKIYIFLQCGELLSKPSVQSAVTKVVLSFRLAKQSEAQNRPTLFEPP
jgi:hypothetical protein